MTLRIVLVILAILCGIALVIQLPTGTLAPVQIAGIGIIFAASAVVAP